jgi:hypothetical protein
MWYRSYVRGGGRMQYQKHDPVVCIRDVNTCYSLQCPLNWDTGEADPFTQIFRLESYCDIYCSITPSEGHWAAITGLILLKSRSLVLITIHANCHYDDLDANLTVSEGNMHSPVQYWRH